MMIRSISSSSTSSSLSSSQIIAPTPYPRAAVAITVQYHPFPPMDPPRYLLIRRANPPDQGKWSLPGGKIHWGESTLEAAQRELWEETNLAKNQCHWFPEAFTTTDAILVPSSSKTNEYNNNNNNNNNSNAVTFHYLIAHCFARMLLATKDGLQLQAQPRLPELQPNDDALDAKWYTLAEIQAMESDGLASSKVVRVIQRAEELSDQGLL